MRGKFKIQGMKVGAMKHMTQKCELEGALLLFRDYLDDG